MAISEGNIPQTTEGTIGTLQSKEREIHGGALEDGHLEEQAWERKESAVDEEKENLKKTVA